MISMFDFDKLIELIMLVKMLNSIQYTRVFDIIKSDRIITSNGGLYIVDTRNVKEIKIEGNANIIIGNNMYSDYILDYIEINGNNNILAMLKTKKIINTGDMNKILLIYIEKCGDTYCAEDDGGRHTLWSLLNIADGGLILKNAAAGFKVLGIYAINTPNAITCANCYEGSIESVHGPYGVQTFIKLYDAVRVSVINNRCEGCINGIFIENNTDDPYVTDNYLQCIRDDCGYGININVNDENIHSGAVINNYVKFTSGTPCSNNSQKITMQNNFGCQ